MSRALEGVKAFHDSASNPDGYCACDGDSECYLHGVLLPEGIRAAASLVAELEAEVVARG